VTYDVEMRERLVEVRDLASLKAELQHLTNQLYAQSTDGRDATTQLRQREQQVRARIAELEKKNGGA